MRNSKIIRDVFIVGIISSLPLQAETSKEAKTMQMIEEIELLQKLKEENDKKLREYEVKEANELRMKVERHDDEIKELKMKVEILENRLDSIERERILNAPLLKMYPPVLFR